MSDHGEKTCPLCAEKMDLTDQQLKPCQCGYQICVWCWHHIVDMAEKDQIEGRCPACRTPYDKEKIVGMTVDFDSLASEGNIERKKVQKSKSKPSEGQRELTSVRVIRRNLVYVVGLPINLADEDLLYHKEYFGQYGKVMKVSMSRLASGVIQHSQTVHAVYITYAKEEEAVRCIQAVHGFTLDGKALKACFGTARYCHTWLRNVTCVNPYCLYLHEAGSQEDTFTKDELISAYTRVQQITGTSNVLQHRSGSMLPPPLDAYCSDNSTTKPIVKVPSTNAASVPSTALPAASSWDPPRNPLSSSSDSSYDSRATDQPSATMNSFHDPNETCDQGSIRQPGPEVSKLPHLEQCRMDSSVRLIRKLSHQKMGSPAQGLSGIGDQICNPRRELTQNWKWRMYHHLIANGNTLKKISFARGLNDSHSRFALDRGSDRLHVPNGFGEKTMSNVEHSLFANEGRNKRSSTLKPSNLLKQHNSQSRFSFARYEESSNQTFGSENHRLCGQLPRGKPIQESVASRDIYQDNLGSLNGFASNYSGGLENYAASPRSRFPDSTSLLRNAYQVQPPVGNPNGANDIEFVDPAILAVGRGMVNADLDMRSGFSSQMNSFGNETGRQMLRQQSLSAAQQQVNGFHHDHRNLSPSLATDPYRYSSRPVHHQTQGSSVSALSQLQRQQQQQPSANSNLSNGHWDKWNQGQSVNSLGMTELLRNERLAFNGSLYNNGCEEPKFRVPSPGKWDPLPFTFFS
ncbi:unnamed protein product [Microthlaspi erraticum]|uniref:RING-type domain-containing protein n=1 Tax=Microthlaspi erraticum TaxID=1685480 RepID=A0A6D2IWB9_9BRAS|nr:unnamed protein product [Microthlaspi erraticum]